MNKKFKIAIGLSTGILLTTPVVLFTLNSCSNNTVETHTNIENSVQQYANDNSISLGFMFNSKEDIIYKQISYFFSKNNIIKPNLENAILRAVKKDLIQNTKYSSLLFGTAWMIDYKKGMLNNNTYYLATNTHVLDLAVNLKGQFEYNSNYYQYNFSFPVNSENVENLRLFLSQPQGTSENNQGYNASYKTFYTDWYQTNIDEKNIGTNIIQYANQKGNNDNINFSFSLYENNYLTNDLLIKDDNTITTIEEQITKNPNNYGIDTSILKLNLNPNEIIPKLETSKQARTQLKKLQKIFNINEKYAGEMSTYIAKLNKTYSDLEENNNVNNYKQSQYFPFQLSKDKISRPVTVGGFPGNNQGNYTYFNTATTNEIEYNRNINRKHMRVLLNNSFIYVKYKEANTGYLKGVDLKPGSSGSMVLDNNKKIIGIYWGAYISGSYGLFVPFDNSWINFIKTNNEFKDSMLGQLLNYKKI